MTKCSGIQCRGPGPGHADQNCIMVEFTVARGSPDVRPHDCDNTVDPAPGGQGRIYHYLVIYTLLAGRVPRVWRSMARVERIPKYRASRRGVMTKETPHQGFRSLFGERRSVMIDKTEIKV
ncbi:MAG: hypothetical protein A4E38_00652 [Methanoregulaceae archaeon PtaB.Bin108]|nr:MAG: hypothetical protein A4E38_00652 [Methanoregulaceae archaeon PtaB.Bin108]OPY46313.1 MAG: hypothetical protein A4E42_00583 [Methanoregulaceae archaeon PtaU1.Bin222]